MTSIFIDKGINSQAAGLGRANDEDIRCVAVGSYIEKGSFSPLKKRAADASGTGAVFLPAAGNRNGTTVNNAGSNGNYWSTTANGTNNAYNVNFNSGNVNPANNNNRYNGFSVRLVRVAPSTYIPAR